MAKLVRSDTYSGTTFQAPQIDLERKRQTVVIIGGGVGGCCTALELARTGKFNIHLLEKNHELMRETSDATPGRLGLGFHYSDKNTALYYLHVTLDFIRSYGNFRQEICRQQSHPLRRGRYFIMKDSTVPCRDILETFEAIKEEYTKMVMEDPSYEVVGTPEDIFRILEPHEFQADVDIRKIEMGIETAEELLDWGRLREYIIHQLEQNRDSVKVRRSTKAFSVVAHECGGYIVDALNIFQRNMVRIPTDVIVNASWYNITKFNKMLGVTNAKKRCNRIKAIATLRLPEELADIPSMFFCMGPFGMFSNKGDRIGMTTYAPETNIAVTSSSGELEPEFSHMYFKCPEREKNLKGQRIVAGISKFIPDLRKAEVLKVNVGIVQTFMNEDTIDHGFKIGNLGFIHDPTKGGIHKRNYSGVEEPMPGYIINACMKLIYCFDNAKLVKDIMLRSLSCE